ncbi:MAG: hypothetical protein K2Q26_06990 [Bdellovibrionales bacterium]|nr:hypothetical protein [Bdellovibrionales bacterium]
MAVIFAGVMGITFYVLSDKLIEQRRLMSGLRRNITHSLALKSATDYVRYGLRNRWCFDDAFLPDRVENCVSNYSHPRSSFRLLMPPSYEQDARAAAAAFPGIFPTLPPAGTSMSLNNFQIITPLTNLSPQHPLFKIMSTVRGKAKSLRVTVEREDDPTLPRPSQEVYVRITSEFLDESNAVLRNRLEAAREVSRYAVTPREVNYFSLILPGNMYLGRSSVSAARGHLAIPDLGKSARGITFESPVFVNGSLFLMSNGFTPAYFNDEAVLGNGTIAGATGQPYDPAMLSGNKKFWRDLNLFGGFEKGFITDSKRDSGLDVLSGQVPGLEVNNEAIARCIDQLRGESNLKMTEKSELKARNLTASGGVYSWRTAFSPDTVSGVQNMFKPQSKRINASSTDMIKSDFDGEDYNSQKHRLIATLELTWKPFASKPRERLELPLYEGQDGADRIKTQFKLIMYDNKKLKDLEDDLKDLKKKKNPTASEEHRMDQLETEIAYLESLFANPPTIQVEARPVVFASGAQPHFRDFEVTIIGADKFKDLGGNLEEPTLKMEVMDFSCDKGRCQRENAAYFKFRNSSGSLTLESNLYKDANFDNAINASGMPTESIDYREILKGCSGGEIDSGGVNLDAIKNNWEQNFALKAENSWHFAADAATPTDRLISSNSLNFETKSIMATCTIASSVDYVAGFYVCQRIVIAPRTRPLTMIGTFIPTKDFVVDPSAFDAGIRMYSMHHPEAVEFLRARSIIKRADGSSCNTIPGPHWHPDPGLPVMADRIRCSTLYFMQGSPTKNPVRWTSVDPDCARVNVTDPDTTCIKRLRNFNIFELERKYGM